MAVKVGRKHISTTLVAPEQPVEKLKSPLEKRIDALHPALRRIVGQYKCRCLPKLYNKSDVAVATDGSVKHF